MIGNGDADCVERAASATDRGPPVILRRMAASAIVSPPPAASEYGFGEELAHSVTHGIGIPHGLVQQPLDANRVVLTGRLG